MKPNTNHTVPMARKTNTTSMNKVYSWAVLLIATAFFSLNTIHAKAQCDNPSKANFKPVVGVTDSFEGSKGELSLVGYQNSETAIYPLFFEWKTESGDVLSSGSLAEENLSKRKLVENGTITGLAPGNYILTTFDSSPACQKNSTSFKIK